MTAHTCPRRADHYSPAALESERDSYREDGTCSFCGSLNPDQFMSHVEAGTELGPTDKNYKVYIDVPNRDVGKPVFTQGHTNPTPADVERMKADPTWAEVRPRVWERTQPAGPIMHAKFYFQHLTPSQCVRFVELLNAGKVKIGEPGRFYVMPFFISRQAA